MSNHATAGNVIALKADIASHNDQPVELRKITLVCNDLGFANCAIAMHLFSSDPTANTGVQAGDNAAYSNKGAGYLGRFEGYFRSFSDLLHATLIPSEGEGLILKPAAGTQRIWFQYQVLTAGAAMTASSTLTPTFRGRFGQG